jgi:hypothetical protein
MFTLTRVIGVVSPGSLQPSQLQVTGDWVCPSGANGGIALEMEVLAPAGHPTAPISATTGSGGASGPAGSVTFSIPWWAQATCGTPFKCRVRGFCNSAWTAWEDTREAEIDCLSCPRIQIDPPAHGPCTGTPPSQDVTLSAVVMLPPGQSSAFTWDFGDGTAAPAGVVRNTTADWNTPFRISAAPHSYPHRSAPYKACLRPANPECPPVCIDVQTTCTSCPSLTPSVTARCVNGAVVLDLGGTITFPPGQSVAVVYWHDPNATAGAPLAGTQVMTTTPTSPPGNPVALAAQTATVSWSPGIHTVELVVAAPAGCPASPVQVTVPACDPCCPSVTLTVSTSGCAPRTGIASFAATVSAPPGCTPPMVSDYVWTVTTPGGESFQKTTPTGSTDTSGTWTRNALSGPLDLSQPGAYMVSVVPRSNGQSITPAAACQAPFLIGQRGFDLVSCCPMLRGVTATALGGCRWAFVASVDNPSNAAWTIDWAFGDGAQDHSQFPPPPNDPNPSVRVHTYGNPPGSLSVAATVVLRSPGCRDFTAGVHVSVPCPTGDTTPPAVTGCRVTRGIGTGSVSVTFNEDVGRADAENIANYSVTVGGMPQTPTSASYDPQTRTVTLDGLTVNAGDRVTVVVTGVHDTAGNPIDTTGNRNRATCSASPPPARPDCSVLLILSIILMGLGALLGVIGCLMVYFSNWPFTAGSVNPQLAQAGLVIEIAGAVLFAIGAGLFAIWWLMCRFATPCATLKLARDILLALCVVFGVIAAIIGFVALILRILGVGTLPWPCFIASLATTALWSWLANIVQLVAEARECSNWDESPAGSSASSSGAGLAGNSGGTASRLRAMRNEAGRWAVAIPGLPIAQPVGLGDVISKATSAVGIQPCGGCRERAELLNRLVSFGRRG